MFSNARRRNSVYAILIIKNHSHFIQRLHAFAYSLFEKFQYAYLDESLPDIVISNPSTFA